MMRFNRVKDYKDQGSAPKKKSSELGSSSKSKVRTRNDTPSDDKWSATANAMNANIGQLPIEIDVDPLLKDIVFSEDLEQKKLITRLYRDIYYNDAIGGSSVDMMSTLPFSDINLGGVTDDRALDVFNSALERLNCRTIFPNISTDFLVDGSFIGSLIFNQSAKRFIDIMPHRTDNAKIDSMPFFGQDPVITVSIPEETTAMLRSGGARVQMLRERLGEDVVSLLTQNTLELDPLTTIYIPRKPFTGGEGVSWFRRILPIYLIEKNLFRGTLVESARRMRGILHVTLGDGEEWEPTVGDMDAITDLFNSADSDPLGAIITTRQGVATEEIRQGGDFWKVTDLWDNTAQFKMRSLGISESFLSGEANYATADTSLTVFIESLRAFRDQMTRRFFYNKLFPLISLVNGYTISNKGKLIRKDGLMDGNVQKSLDRLADGSKLLVPTVHWSKQLKPEGDQSYMDMLQTLTDKGVPVPLRAIAAAGGFNLDALLADSDDDMSLLRRIGNYNKRVADIKKEFGMGAEEGSAFASAHPSAAREYEALAKGATSAVLSENGGGRVSLANRDFEGKNEIIGRTKTGKAKFISNQKRQNERANKNLAKALKEITQNKKTTLTHSSHTPKRGN